MRVGTQTGDGVYWIDLEDEEVEFQESGELPPPFDARISLPRLVAADAAGSLVVAVVDRRPPLMVSHDAGSTWREAGGGLPAGRAVAISPEDAETVVFAARNRLYVSRDGGRFWRALAPELPEIERIAFGVTA